jgi:ADP-ribose pyrophosphatase
MEAWRRIGPTKVDKVGWRTIVTKTFEMPDGQTAEFHTLAKEHGHCIATIGLTALNEVIIARQFRAGPERIMDELPGGGADEGEDFAVAAGRELLEETGYQAEQIEHIGDVYKDAYTNTTWHYFLAIGCKKVADQTLDNNEHVETVLVSIPQLFENARSGLMTDVDAVFLAYDKLIALQGGSNGESY